jgi:hypothetical protein
MIGSIESGPERGPYYLERCPLLDVPGENRSIPAPRVEQTITRECRAENRFAVTGEQIGHDDLLEFADRCHAPLLGAKGKTRNGSAMNGDRAADLSIRETPFHDAAIGQTVLSLGRRP